MINLKIQQLINSVNDVCKQVINDGVPVYAVVLALKDIETNGLMPLVNQQIKKEVAELQQESIEAKPVGEPHVNKVIDENKDIEEDI